MNEAKSESISSYEFLLRNYEHELALNSEYRDSLFDFSEVKTRNFMSDLPVLCHSPEMNFYFYYDKNFPNECVHYDVMFCALFNIHTNMRLGSFDIKRFTDGMGGPLDSLKSSETLRDMTMAEKLDILDKKNSFVVMLQKDFL